MNMVCSFCKCLSDFINFDVANIEEQDDFHSCGLYALACVAQTAKNYLLTERRKERLSHHEQATLIFNHVEQLSHKGLLMHNTPWS